MPQKTENLDFNSQLPLSLSKLKRIPNHVGIIPDGNRRFALANSLLKHEGYESGVLPGFHLYEKMLSYGIKEATFYGFTKDNTKRPKIETAAYIKACVDAVNIVSNRDANILVIGNTNSSVFPEELLPYANNRVNFGKGLINLNFLINYDWNWDLSHSNKVYNENTKENNNNNENFKNSSNDFVNSIATANIPRMELIVRWGGMRRLSGFLPVQSVYSDFFVIDDFWPNYKEHHFDDAMNWYQKCDVTLGG